MSSRTKQGLERGVYSATRQEKITGRRPGIASLDKPDPRGRSDTDKFLYLIDEVESLWDTLKGRGDDKNTRHPRMRLSQALDQYGRPTRLWCGGNDEWITSCDMITTTDTVSIIEAASQEVWVPAEGMSFAPGATNPAVWNYSLGGSRLAGIDVPTGSTNIYLWHGFYPKSDWAVGTTVSTRIYYSLDTLGVPTDVVRITTSGLGYDTGDALTSPNISWNETIELDVNGASADTMYYTDIPETAATIAAEDFIQIRLAYTRAHANYTYTGTVTFHGALFTLV